MDHVKRHISRNFELRLETESFKLLFKKVYNLKVSTLNFYQQSIQTSAQKVNNLMINLLKEATFCTSSNRLKIQIKPKSSKPTFTITIHRKNNLINN